MTTENNFKKGKYTLIYSPTADIKHGNAVATTNDGKHTAYTLMTDEAEFGDWRKTYRWEDAVVVGYINSNAQITQVNLIALEELRSSIRRFL